MNKRLLFLLTVLMSTAAHADNLSITKSSVVVSDAVNALNPKALPGAVVDYSLLVTNPLGNLFATLKTVVITDVIPTTVKFRYLDYQAGGGPVEFVNGSLLGTGILGSGQSYTFTSLSSTTDGIEFYDGASWAYVPHDDGTGSGYDPNVRAIRVTMTGTSMTPGGTFRLRFRVQVK